MKPAQVNCLVRKKRCGLCPYSHLFNYTVQHHAV